MLEKKKVILVQVLHCQKKRRKLETSDLICFIVVDILIYVHKSGINIAIYSEISPMWCVSHSTMV